MRMTTSMFEALGIIDCHNERAHLVVQKVLRNVSCMSITKYRISFHTYGSIFHNLAHACDVQF